MSVPRWFEHQANTTGVWKGSSFVWWVTCPCGWTGPERESEYSADWDRLDHTDGDGTGF